MLCRNANPNLGIEKYGVRYIYIFFIMGDCFIVEQ